MVRIIARTDANQAEIVDALREVGAAVLHLHQVGKGCPDILVSFRDTNYLMEIKTANGELTPDEINFFQTWRGPVCVVRNAEDALRTIGAIE